MAEKQVTEVRVKELIAEAMKGLPSQTSFNELIAKALKGLVSEETLRQALDNLVSRETLNSITSELITKDQWNEALEGMLSAPVELTGIRPDLKLAEARVDPIPGMYLEGLVFRSSKVKKGETGKTNVPTERPLVANDVLSWRDNGDTVMIITSDGHKYTVDKE